LGGKEIDMVGRKDILKIGIDVGMKRGGGQILMSG
jgi:hypothetical protein